MAWFHIWLILFFSNYFRWKYLGAVAWRLPLRATLLLWPKTITTFWFSILSMCLNAQLQLSRPKYLRDRLLKRWWNFCIPKKNPHFLIPVLSKNIVKLYREGSNRPHPHLLLKKKVKTLQKESRKKWYHIYTKKSIFLTRKITVRCSIKNVKKENHLWCFTKLKFKKKNKKTKQD